ncbi:MAG: amidase family protein, partial [Desulfobacterales bacterium]|nr:amidase family protein [Desulfobacterales bacterium]
PDILSGVSPAVAGHLAAVRERLLRAGAAWVDLDLPAGFAGVAAAHRTLFDAELAVYHRERYQTHREQYPPNLRQRIAEGMAVPVKAYIEALGHRMAFQAALAASLTSVDALVMPATPATAPPGLASTGSPLLNTPWSFAGFPAVSLPSGLDARGLPFGLQIVGKAGAEKALAMVASWCETQLCFDARPTDGL